MLLSLFLALIITIIIFVLRTLIFTSKVTGRVASSALKRRGAKGGAKGKLLEGIRGIGHAVNMTARAGLRLVILGLKVLRGIVLALFPVFSLVSIIVSLIFIAGAAGAYIFIFRTDYYISNNALNASGSNSGTYIETNAVDLDKLDWDSIKDDALRKILREIAEDWPENMTQERAECIIKAATRYGISTYSWDGRGGDSDDQTIFDCSGFVSWSLNKGGHISEIPCNLLTSNYVSCTGADGSKLKLTETDNISDILPADVALQSKTMQDGHANHALLYVGKYKGEPVFLHCISANCMDIVTNQAHSNVVLGPYGNGSGWGAVATYRIVEYFPKFYKREVSSGGDAPSGSYGSSKTGKGCTDLGVCSFDGITEYVIACLERVYGKDVNYEKIIDKSKDGDWIRPKSCYGKISSGGTHKGIFGGSVTAKSGEKCVMIQVSGKNGIILVGGGAYKGSYSSVKNKSWCCNPKIHYTAEAVESAVNSMKCMHPKKAWRNSKKNIMSLLNYYTFTEYFLESPTGQAGTWKAMMSSNGKQLYSRIRVSATNSGVLAPSQHPGKCGFGSHGPSGKYRLKGDNVGLLQTTETYLKAGHSYKGTGALDQGLQYARSRSCANTDTAVEKGRNGNASTTGGNSHHTGGPKYLEKSEAGITEALSHHSGSGGTGGCISRPAKDDIREICPSKPYVGMCWIWENLPAGSLAYIF
jgi:cell wall-associated NlpC family hydrolase